MFLVLSALTPLSWSIETVNMGIMQVVFPRGLVGSAIATSLLYSIHRVIKETLTHVGPLEEGLCHRRLNYPTCFHLYGSTFPTIDDQDSHLLTSMTELDVHKKFKDPKFILLFS
jgi:hypothetical protein